LEPNSKSVIEMWPARIVNLELEEPANANYGNAFELSEIKQVMVSRHNHLRASVDRQCQEHVVSEIVLDSCDFGGHVYDFTDLY